MEKDFKIAYLIMCHKNPRQVNRLISQLKTDNSICFVHVDKKSNMEISKLKNCVLVKNRIAGELNSASLIEIAVKLMETALQYAKEMKIKFSYYSLMSGQDYLVSPIELIETELKEEYPQALIDCTPWGKNNWVDKGSHNCAWFNEINGKINGILNNIPVRRIIKMPLWIINQVIKGKYSCAKVLKRNDIQIYGGSAWWILPDIIVEYLIEKKDDYLLSKKYYSLRHTGSPEEMVFQTVLMNSEYASLIEVNPEEMIAQNCKTFANFTPYGKSFTGHPYIFTINDIGLLNSITNKFFFARKFEIDEDEEILNWIDNNVLKSHYQKDNKII